MKAINEFDVSDRMKLRLQVGGYGGDERIGIRQWVEIDNNYIPTKKGINFSSEWIDRFIAVVEKLKDI